MYLTTLGISIPDEEMAFLEAFARKEGCSVEEIIIRAVAQYVARKSHSI